MADPRPGQPARILFLINSLETGGAERQLALTVANLDPERFHPIVCCLFRGGPYLDEIHAAGVETHAFDLRKTLLAAIRGARRAVSDLRPDLVHTAMFEAHVAGRLAARKHRLPAVSHATNAYDDAARYQESPVPGWKLRAARGAERWSARRSRAHIVAVGQVVAGSAARYLAVSPDRITVIRRGWDFTALEEASHRALEAPAWPDGARPRLLTVGRLQPQKGLEHLLRAIPRLHERHPDAHLAVAGAGPLADDLGLLATGLGVDGSVSFLGVRRDVPALLAEADAFVFPSLWEGAAGALVEAMAMAVPVAATDIPPLREISALGAPAPDGSARHFPPKDPHGIADAVAAIADDPDAARSAAALAAPRIRAAHDIAANTRALEAFYGRLLGPEGVAGPPSGGHPSDA